MSPRYSKDWIRSGEKKSDCGVTLSTLQLKFKGGSMSGGFCPGLQWSRWFRECIVDPTSQ
jgi:hypothetical protein